MSLLQSFQRLNQVNYREWFAAHADLPLIQCLSAFIEEILFAEFATAPIYIFIDEIDSLLSLEFPVDDFFAWIRSCYNQRSHDVRYQRFNIALFGVATPADLIATSSAHLLILVVPFSSMDLPQKKQSHWQQDFNPRSTIRSQFCKPFCTGQKDNLFSLKSSVNESLIRSSNPLRFRFLLVWSPSGSMN